MYLRDAITVARSLGLMSTFKLLCSRRRIAHLLPSWMGVLDLPGHAAPLHFRHATSDKYVIAEVLGKRQYAKLLGGKDVKIIVDAGANIGTASRFFLEAFPCARVVALEPDLENFEVLRRNLAYYGERATTLNVALVDVDRRMTAVRGGFRDGAEWSVQVVDGDDVEGWSVQTVMERCSLRRIDIFKIDIEGFEKAVFSSPDLRWLDATDTIAVELHDNEARRLFSDVVSQLGGQIESDGEVTIWRRAQVPLET